MPKTFQAARDTGNLYTDGKTNSEIADLIAKCAEDILEYLANGSAQAIENAVWSAGYIAGAAGRINHLESTRITVDGVLYEGEPLRPVRPPSVEVRRSRPYRDQLFAGEAARCDEVMAWDDLRSRLRRVFAEVGAAPPPEARG